MRRITIYVLLLGVALFSWPDAGHADWPVPRGDRQRTGSVGGEGGLSNPVPYWRYYLGGAISATGARVADVDGDHVNEVLIVAGGRVFARGADDSLVWQSDPIRARYLVAIDDLDGDGHLDLVVAAPDRVVILSLESGEAEWEEPGDDLGTLGGVRVADLDGDGVADLLVQECACCRIDNGKTGFAYRFADGYDAAEKLWTLPYVLCGGKHSTTVLDADGDGAVEVALGTNRSIKLLDGATGLLLAESPNLGDRVGLAQCLPADVDAVPGHELVCVLTGLSANLPGSMHRIFVLGYRQEPSPVLELRWEHDVGDLDNSVSVEPGMVADLDGDGLFEIVVSGVNFESQWRTYVYDAAGGEQLAVLLGQRVAGTASVEAPNRATLLTTAEGTLSAWSFHRSDDPALSFLWSMPDHGVLSEPDWARVPKTYLASRVLAPDLSGDGVGDLVTMTQTQQRLEVYRLGAGGPSIIASRDLSAPWLHAWTSASSGSDDARLLVATTAGRMQLVDSGLGSLNGAGVRFGGYYATGSWRELAPTPVVGQLGASGDSVLVSDSRGALVRIDPVGGTLTSPPPAIWSVEHASGPIVDPHLDHGQPGIACLRRDPLDDNDNPRIAVLEPDGATVWQSLIPGDVMGDIVPARLDGDATTDLIVEWGRRSDLNLQHRALSGVDGHVVWNAEPVMSGLTRLCAGAAVADWNGDTVDDLVFQYYGTHVLSGADGTEIAASPGTGPVYFMPTIYDVDGDDEDEITLQGGYDPPRTLETDLTTTLWTGSEIDRPYPYGAIAECPDSPPLLVEGSLLNPSTLKMTELSGDQAGHFETVVLAGGGLFADEAAAEAAGEPLGQLTSTSLHRNLTGQGHPSALVGSDDGWLYAVDPCSRTLDFAVDLGAAVGAIAFGDTDGDGYDEVVVSAGDGYLYGLDEPLVAAPEFVYDTDPAAGITDADVDIVSTTSSLSATWASVDGASSYEISVVRIEDEQIISVPPWQDVGTATSTTVSGLELVDGARYRVAVRAVAAGGRSPDVASDGVTVLLEGSPDAGPAAGGDAGVGAADAGIAGGDDEDRPCGGCGCRTTARDRSGGLIWLVVVLVAVRRRRSRRG